MDKLLELWRIATTPGTQLPSSTTIIVIAVIAVCSFLLPSFVRWRTYRREEQGKLSTADKLKKKASHPSNKKKIK